MDYVIVGSLLVALAVGLVVRHCSFWRSLNKEHLDDSEVQYFRRQFRRRVITSSLVGVIGVTFVVLYWIKSPVVFSIFLFGWLITIGWILLMALSDILSTRSFKSELRVSQIARRSELEAEIERLRNRQRTGEENGKGAK